jgi:DNA-binding CsgD family transcriptional regulator
MENGIQSFDLKRMTFGRFIPIGTGADGLGPGCVSRIMEDRSGQFWIGTENGLYRFDRLKETFMPLLHDPRNSQSISHNNILSLYDDRSGLIWIGTDGGGLNCYDPVSRQMTRFRHREGDPHGLSSDTVYCITEDSRGALWLGTNGGGLDHLDRKTGIFSQMTKEDGLPNNVIFGILEDARDFLWLSTNHGLSRFDPRRMTFKNFTARDGLQGNEFLPHSYFRSQRNELFFGGRNGLTYFYPQQITDNPFVPAVVITKVTLHNSNRTFGGNLRNLGEIRLTHGDTVVTFSFAALCYVDSTRNQYAYRIEPLTRDWIQLGNKHEVTVNNLSPGRYVFRVIGTNNDGLWNEQGASISIRISPPWWRATWFQALQILSCLALFIFWYRTRMRRLAARIRTETAMENFIDKQGLSEREKEILRLVLKGKSNKEIEKELFIAIGTVKNHIYNIYQKLDVQNRTQLITLFKNLRIK